VFPIASPVKRVAFGFLLLLAGCDDDYDYFANLMAGASCDRYAACCTDLEFDGQTWTSDAEQCRETNSSWYRRSFVPSLERAIEAGRVEFHLDAMSTCMRELESMSCVEAMTFLQNGGLWTKCPDALEGQVALGGRCESPWDCTAGFCSGLTLDLSDNIVGLGVCAELPSVGMECPDYRCAAGAYCDDALICQPVGPDGSSCLSDWHCASGSCNDRICGERTRCNGT
jgi:hypothetical protein